MKTRTDTVTTVDPEDTAAVRAWADRRAAAQKALSAAQAELAQLNTVLSQPPATTVLTQLATAEAATVGAQAVATTTAEQAATDADAAARYETNQLAGAEAAADAATAALSQALAALLRDASTTSALTATVDGLSLRQRYLDGSATPARWDYTTVPFLDQPGDVPLDPELVLPAVGSDDFQRLIAVLARLDAGVDAVADLVTAESVHHLVDGNLVRSGAALDIATNGSVPDSFEVIRTPQSGQVVSHRALVVSDPAAGPHWDADPGPAARADPLLAALVTGLVPAPSSVGVTVSRGPNGDDAFAFTLDRLGLDPLELVRVCGDPGEIAQRIALVARSQWFADLGTDAMTGTVQVASGSAVNSLDDLNAATDAVRALVGRSRALAEDDLRGPTDAPAGVPDRTVATLTARVGAVEAALDATVAALDAAAAGTDALALAAALLEGAEWLVPGAVPQLDSGVPPVAALQAQARRVSAELARRRAAAPTVAADGDNDTAARTARDRLATILARPLPILVELDAPSDPGWGPVTGTRLTGAEPVVLRQWLTDHARVRPALGSLADAYELAEIMATGASLDLVATQLLPGGPGTTWSGASPQPPSGLVSIVVQRGFSAAPAMITGLAVDSWTQRLPGTSHQAGIAFHVDVPDAAPPQAVLIAVAPDLSPRRQPATWDLETLTDSVLAALALARDRAVTAENASISGITVRGA